MKYFSAMLIASMCCVASHGEDDTPQWVKEWRKRDELTWGGTRVARTKGAQKARVARKTPEEPQKNPSSTPEPESLNKPDPKPSIAADKIVYATQQIDGAPRRQPQNAPAAGDFSVISIEVPGGGDMDVGIHKVGSRIRITGEGGFTLQVDTGGKRPVKLGSNGTGMIMRDMWDGVDCEIQGTMVLREKGTKAKILSAKFTK